MPAQQRQMNHDAGAGVGVNLTRDVSLDVGFVGRFDGNLIDYGGNANLGWRF
ncbi:hypothetical protein [Kushneria indalinina]|uniref:hypothetical protein n=1 Tax=Kushneria indalinina TaxID=184067 RepID=UPI0014748877|nr:hypothetical protein [Kushneria indalinina]